MKEFSFLGVLAHLQSNTDMVAAGLRVYSICYRQWTLLPFWLAVLHLSTWTGSLPSVSVARWWIPWGNNIKFNILHTSLKYTVFVLGWIILYSSIILGFVGLLVKPHSLYCLCSPYLSLRRQIRCVFRRCTAIRQCYWFPKRRNQTHSFVWINKMKRAY